MPAITRTAATKVLVTGASGFLGVHSCKALLERGLSVRATVRSTDKGEFMRNLGGVFADKERFEYVIVEDIGKECAFDEAVKGVDAIEHIATPVVFVSEHPDQIIKPAVQGAVGILQSAKQFAPTVKRVLLVSSTATLGPPKAGTNISTEADWGESALEHVKAQGSKSHGGIVYAASKVLAERAAWEYVKKEEGLGFDLTTILPPWLWGPVINEVTAAARTRGLWSSVGIMFGAWDKPLTNEQLAAYHGNWIDVRDVANLSVDLLTAEKAGNERIIISAGPYSYQDVLDCKPPLKNIPVGNPGATKDKAPTWGEVLSTEKVQRILGKSTDEMFRPLEQTVHETVQSCLDRDLVSEEGVTQFDVYAPSAGRAHLGRQTAIRLVQIIAFLATSTMDFGEDDISDKIGEIFKNCQVLHRSSYPNSSIDFEDLDLTVRVKQSRYAAGRGHYSDVYKGELDSSTLVGVKLLRLPSYSSEQEFQAILLRFFREFIHWHGLDHINIARLLGFTLADGNIGFVSLWYHNGNLVQHLSKHPEASKQDLMLDVAEGIQYIHTHPQPLLHGDLKGANVLINENGIACLGDFGISKQVHDLNRKTGFTTTSGVAGTLPWMAPELLASPSISFSSDVYSFGGVLLEICCPGKYPYDYLSQETDILLAKIRGELPNRTHYPELDHQDALWDLIVTCLAPTPQERPNIDVIVQILYRQFDLAPRAFESILPRSKLGVMDESSEGKAADAENVVETQDQNLINTLEASDSPPAISNCNQGPPTMPASRLVLNSTNVMDRRTNPTASTLTNPSGAENDAPEPFLPLTLSIDADIKTSHSSTAPLPTLDPLASVITPTRGLSYPTPTIKGRRGSSPSQPISPQVPFGEWNRSVTSFLSSHYSVFSADANTPVTPTPQAQSVASLVRRVRGTSDSYDVHCVSEAMIGEFLFKYQRRLFGKGHTSKRHQRFFWIHPYRKTLHWSLADPNSSRASESNTNSVSFNSVRSVPDPNPIPPGLYQHSLLVSTPQREIKLTCRTEERHNLWLTALSTLLGRDESPLVHRAEEIYDRIGQPEQSTSPLAMTRPLRSRSDASFDITW